MILGIDATNIRGGGGLTHLKGILKNANPNINGWTQIIVWSNDLTLNELPDLPWLIKKSSDLLNKSFVYSFLFQWLYLSREAHAFKCDILLIPGGTFFGNFKPIVTMCRNMLPFEKLEANRFSNWQTRLRFKILYYTQRSTFKKSKGVIFLTEYARDYVIKKIGLKNDAVIIPHGINWSFVAAPRVQKDILAYTFQNPYKLLYVSIVTVYKHQWNVAEAVLKLREEGYAVALELVGGHTSESLEQLNTVLVNDYHKIISYKGLIPYEELADVYKNADAFIFASSCENMPNILIEAMSAGLPIASSNMGPMPEVLGEAGFYFNPLKVEEIYEALKIMLDSKELREQKANLSYNNSINYGWKECAEKTFDYLLQVSKN